MACCSLMANEIFVLNTNSQSISKIDTNTTTTNNSFSEIGLYGNQIIYHENRLYVVNSGDNNIQVINADTGLNIGYINLENSSNPWNAVIHNDYIYISGYYTNKIYKANLNNFTDIQSVSVGNTPAGLKIYDNKLFVAISGYAISTYLESYICVINLDNFQVIDNYLSGINAQDLVFTNGLAYILFTGNYYDVLSKIIIWNYNTNTVIKEVNTTTYLSTINLAPNNTIYLGNAFTTNFTALDTNTNELITSNIETGDILSFDNEFIYVVETNWTANSKIKKYSIDNVFIQEWTTARGSNSICLRNTVNSIADPTVKKDIEIFLYPNPFIEFISFKSSTTKINKIEIFNVKGQRMAQNSNTNQISTKHLPAGVYFARVSTENDAIIKKIIKLN
jgi:hypothetical protein